MALSLPIVSPSDGQSPPSDDGSVSPHTPVSPKNAQSMSLPQSPESQNPSHPHSPSSNPSATQVKRKPSRRANTAERRATHNAVERQRRETLNGRFLDLAALLPNLSQIRRPSKSAIVNSSIAHIHASRRHRLLASRELRLLKLESDALRRELNEWRDRAGLPRVDEPVRGEGFTMVLSGEVEVLTAVVGEEEEEGQGQYDGFEEGDEEISGAMPMIMDDTEDIMPADPQNGNIYGQSIAASGMNPADMKIARMIPRAQPASNGGPMIAQIPPSVSYENPAMPAHYEPQVAPHFGGASHIGHHAMTTPEADKVSTWAANMYSGYNSQVQIQPQQSMITPSNATHAAPHTPSSTPATSFTDYAYLANLKRQQLLTLQHSHGVMHYTADGDDTSSVGSSQSGRGRSGSASAGSGFSPPPTSSGTYELSNAISDFNLTRRMGTTGLHLNTAVPNSWSGRGEERMNEMVMKQAMNSSMHVLSNGGGYGMML